MLDKNGVLSSYGEQEGRDIRISPRKGGEREDLGTYVVCCLEGLESDHKQKYFTIFLCLKFFHSLLDSALWGIRFLVCLVCKQG